MDRPSRTPAKSADDLGRIVASADRLEQAVRALERTPGVGRAAVARLRDRRPGPGRPSPLSTVVLVRLAARGDDPAGMSAAIPFLADANPFVQVEVAEALEPVDLPDIRAVLLRLAADEPGGAFWEPLVDLLASRDEPGVARLLVDLLQHVAAPGAQAAVIEVLPFLAGPKESTAVRRALERFLPDGRAVPGADTDEGPATFAMLAAEALGALDAER